MGKLRCAREEIAKIISQIPDRKMRTAAFIVAYTGVRLEKAMQMNFVNIESIAEPLNVTRDRVWVGQVDEFRRYRLHI